MSCPEIGLHKFCKPMDGQFKKKRATLPRMLREQIVQEYLSGLKTGAMLDREHGICPKTINKMVSLYK